QTTPGVFDRVGLNRLSVFIDTGAIEFRILRRGLDIEQLAQSPDVGWLPVERLNRVVERMIVEIAAVGEKPVTVGNLRVFLPGEETCPEVCFLVVVAPLFERGGKSQQSLDGRELHRFECDRERRCAARGKGQKRSILGSKVIGCGIARRVEKVKDRPVVPFPYL